MEQYLAWLVIGLTLVVVEVLTGTFYLLVLGVACFGAAGAAFLGQSFAVQSIVAAVVAAVGLWLVYAYRARNRAQQMAPIDAGQPAAFESWIDRAAGLARVRYRGATWEARVDGAAALEPGAVLYVTASRGNTLTVSVQRPA